MIDASENGAETLAFYNQVNPSDPARALFDEQLKTAAFQADRIVLGASLIPDIEHAAAMMTVSQLIAHFVDEADDQQLYSRRNRLSFAIRWAAEQTPEVAALFLILLRSDCAGDLPLITEQIPENYALLCQKVEQFGEDA